VLSLGTGLADLAGTGLGTLAGMGASKARGEPVDFGVASEGMQEGKFTFAPRSEGGQEFGRGLATVMEPLERGMQAAGQKTADVTGSPAAGAAVYTALNVLDPEMLAPAAAKIAALRGASRVARGATFEPVSSAGPGGKQRGAWSPGTTSGHAVDPNLSDEGFLAELSPHLTDAERKQLRKGDTAAIRDVFRDTGALDPNDIAPAALAGRAKRGWYKASGQALQDVFGEDSPRFVSLLAATSPRVSVEANLRNALNIWREWNKAGRPQDAESVLRIMEDTVQRSPLAAADKSSVLGAWKNNTVQALTGDLNAPLEDMTAFLSGPKVESFRRNLLGDLDEVTNDAWQATATGQEQTNFSGRSPTAVQKAAGAPGGIKSPGYMATSAAAREAAKKLTKETGEAWTPAEVQETVWSLTKAAWEKAQATGQPVGQVLRELQHSEVADVPDFSGLLGQGEYAKLLDEAGYGPQVKALAAKYQSPAPLEGLPSDVNITPGLEGFERQLSATFRDRVLPSDVRAARKRSRTGSDVGGGLYTRGGGVPAGGPLAGRVIQSYAPGLALADALRRHGVSAPDIHELDPAQSADLFHAAIGRAKNEAGPVGAAVQQYSPDEYAKMRLFMPDDMKSGFAVKPGDAGVLDLVSLFNQKSSAQTGFAYPALGLGMSEGVKSLDAFDTVLPKMYSQMGMQSAARLPFNPKYAPEGWDYEKMSRWNKGQPDVVYMGLPPWSPDDAGRLVPPETSVEALGPRKYNSSPTRNALLAKTPEGAVQKQRRLVTPTAKERDVLALAAASGGRVPSSPRALAKALREFKSRQPN
jgi:hypothetical protein